MSTDKKYEDNINVSLKSKPYGVQAKPIVDQWREDKSKVIGTEVCRRILLVERIEASPQMQAILQLFDAIQTRLGEDATPEQVDKALSNVIQLRQDWVLAYLFNRPLPEQVEDLPWKSTPMPSAQTSTRESSEVNPATEPPVVEKAKPQVEPMVEEVKDVKTPTPSTSTQSPSTTPPVFRRGVTIELPKK